MNFKPVLAPTKPRRKIPVNVISGFLGSGKTTTILQILKQVPKGERWAVLVNEFGEIGIDGAILQESGAVVKEVAGGCICCVNNLPLQISLNMLIAKAKPDRLLIEPTGLAHPGNLLDTLQSESYAGLFDVRAMLTLVDARHAQSERHKNDQIFIDQLSSADIIVASKNDLADDKDKQLLNEFLLQLTPARAVHTAVKQGEIDMALLDLPCHWQGGRHHPQHPASNTNLFGVSKAPVIPLPPQLDANQLFLRKENRSNGAFSCGWLFADHIVFDMNRLVAFLHSMAAERVKAVMRTNHGNYIFNMENTVLSIHDLNDLHDSRLEIIDHHALDWDVIEKHLLNMAFSTSAEKMSQQSLVERQP